MGEKKGPDEVYCRSCGKPVKKKAEICPNCGVANEYNESNQAGRQSQPDPGRGQNTQQQLQDTAKTLESSVTDFASSEPTKHDPSEHTSESSDKWYYGIGSGIALWILGFAMPEASAIAGLFFLMAWVLMPVSIYYDREWIRATTNWNPNLLVWVVLSIIPVVNIIAGGIYLFRRYNTSEVSSATRGYSTTREEDPALAQLRERYSRGELTDEEFEQKVEQIVGTETTETAQTHVRMKEDSKKHE